MSEVDLVALNLRIISVLIHNMTPDERRHAATDLREAAADYAEESDRVFLAAMADALGDYDR